ncbi:MAG: hypothetical protein NPIRA02_34590 [Nitrospirales bacterium]|nr:MAG: hypothetical protein NPIRA02_34590 [Nitrospirales bacterium]
MDATGYTSYGVWLAAEYHRKEKLVDSSLAPRTVVVVPTDYLDMLDGESIEEYQEIMWL